MGLSLSSLNPVNLVNKGANLIGDAVGTVTNAAGDALKPALKVGQWAFDHPLEAAALGAGGYYFAPEISAWLAPTGEAVAGTAAGTAAGAGAVELGTTSGAAWDAATMGAYGGPAAITAATGLTAAQLATLAKAGVSLAGLMAAKGIQPSSSGGLLTQQQDRSGFSSGSANYSPEYYAAIQSKYNQYMPQQQGKDITTDLKNWYETKYTPNATGTSGTSGGTGYTTDQSLINLNLTKPVIPPVAPLYKGLTAGSSDTAIANAYSQFIAQNGGNTVANRQAANDYLIKLGIPQSQINTAYNTFLSKLPASGNTPSSIAANATPSQIAQAFTAYVQGSGGNTQANRVAAAEYLKKIGVPASTIEAGYKSYLNTLPASGTSASTLNAKATPSQIAAAYANYISGAGGDTAVNKQTAIQYLKNIGVSDATIQAAYPVFQSTYGGTNGSGGMLTGSRGSSGSSNSYTSLSGNSAPEAIATAYREFVAGSGGDTAANQAAAVNYLSGLGVDQDTINAAYDVYKGP